MERLSCMSFSPQLPGTATAREDGSWDTAILSWFLTCSAEAPRFGMLLAPAPFSSTFQRLGFKM